MKNKGLSGNNGTVWLNGEKIAQVKSIEAKITGNFEEVNTVGRNATDHVYTGWSGEGTLVLQKIDSTALNLLAESFKTGTMPDFKIVTKLEELGSGKSERASISDIVFTEMALAKFEAKAVIEDELPFKFSEYEVIETI